MKARLRRWSLRLGIALVVVFLVVTFAAVVYDSVTPPGQPPRALYQGPFVEVDGTLLAYRRWGTHGTPIVLLGGFAEPSDVWRKVAPLLARAGHRVYALDLPPFGYSERKGPYGVAAWERELEGFERALRIPQPLLVGHSLGAATAVGEALRRPAALRGIVLLDGDALGTHNGNGWVAHLALDPWFTAAYRFLTGWDWLARRILAGAYGPGAPPLTAAEVERWQRPFRVAGTAQAFKDMVRQGIPGWTEADLRRVRGVHALVVWGTLDRNDSPAAGRSSARALRARFVPIAGAAHLSLLTHPRQVASAVLAFARHPDGGRR